MRMLNKAQAMMLGAAVAVAATLPMAAAAEGHTSEFAGNKGFVGAKGYVGPVKHTTHRHKYARKVKKRTHAQAAAVSPCPANFYGLYRGTMYCQAGVVLK